jgi:hypothetical protein
MIQKLVSLWVRNPLQLKVALNSDVVVVQASTGGTDHSDELPLQELA